MDTKQEPIDEADDDSKATIEPMNTLSAQLGQQITLTCVKCKQRIALSDRFFNLPVNASRRRVWCDRLGLNFNLSMLKHKSWNAKPICHRHFAITELSTYPTKSKMERCGYPMLIRSSGSSLQRPNIRSLRVKRQPWPCTMCSFSCFSVSELFEHVAQSHLSVKKTKSQPLDGYACPFCRRCAYGYRTLSGFERHMSFIPTQHFLLQKIVESATAQGREGYLVPVESWSTWTEENVSMALFGFVPKPVERKNAEAAKGMSLDELRVRQEMFTSEAMNRQLLSNRGDDSIPTTATAILTGTVPLSLDFLNTPDESALNSVSVSLDGPSYDYQKSANTVSSHQLTARVKEEGSSSTATNGMDVDFAADASGGISATSIMTLGRDEMHFAHDFDADADEDDEEPSSAGNKNVNQPTTLLTLADMLPSPDTVFEPIAQSSNLQSTDAVHQPPLMPLINPIWARRQGMVDKMMTRKLESAENRRKFFGPIDVDAETAAPRPLVARLTFKTTHATPSRLLVPPSDPAVAPTESGGVGSDCSVCGIRFFSDGALRKHMIGVHGRNRRV